jgi:hypothetical protein
VSNIDGNARIESVLLARIIYIVFCTKEKVATAGRMNLRG